MSPRKYEHPATEDLEFVRVLAAVSDPIRLEMVRRLADGQELSLIHISEPTRPY